MTKTDVSEVVVGQNIWWVSSNIRRNQTSGYAVTIKKIGRKWISLSNNNRIDKDTWIADGGQYSSPGCCYVSENEYLNEVRLSDAWSSFRRKVDSFMTMPTGVTLDDIDDAITLLQIN